MNQYDHNVCRQYVGKMVHVHTTKGIHRGYVDGVAKSGLYLRPIPDGGHVAAYDLRQDISTAEGADTQLQAHNVFYGGYGRYGRYGGYGGYGYGYGPYAAARFFVPFLTILALTSLLWW